MIPGPVVLILAAGESTRFGGGKMTALLDGRPLLAHVLAAARRAGLGRLVVVLGRDAVAVAAVVLAADRAGWTGTLRVLNPAPERGLSSSVRVGMAAATALAGPDGVLVLLGDQPRVRPDVIRAILAADRGPETVAVAPQYAGDGALNPVLVLPPGYPLAGALDGDRGLGPLLARAADGVVRVSVPGVNPDVDTAADLAALAGGPS